MTSIGTSQRYKPAFLLALFLFGLGACAGPITQTESRDKWHSNREAYQAYTMDKLEGEAENGNQEAKIQMAVRFITGDRVERDQSLGVQLLQEIAADGDARAQYLLGAAFAQGAGVEKNESRAVGWFKKSASQNYYMGQYWYAFMLSRGRGVEKKDWRTAIKWFRRAADQGVGNAQFSMGEAYDSCRGGLKRDYEKAAMWYRKADGVQDNMSARYNLRRLIELGLVKWKDGDTGDPPLELAPMKPEYIRPCEP